MDVESLEFLVVEGGDDNSVESNALLRWGENESDIGFGVCNKTVVVIFDNFGLAWAMLLWLYDFIESLDKGMAVNNSGCEGDK